VYAQKISVHDEHRLARALDVIESTGKPYSSFKGSNIDIPYTELDYDFRCYCLMLPKPLLVNLIDQRCLESFSNGFIQVCCLNFYLLIKIY
jgi:tRNA A37 N6-isopentenylltransferase MiaA